MRAHQRRESYDPAQGRYEDWAFGFARRVVANYRGKRWRHNARVSLAIEDVPDAAVEGPSPEEETDLNMLRPLLDKCLATLDPDLRGILLAKESDGISMTAIAAAHGIAPATAYEHYHKARALMQKALDREQTTRKLALGLPVLPITLDQLIRAEGKPAAVPAETMRRLWEKLDRVRDADKVTGKLRDDGPDVPRYSGSPSELTRPGLGARVLRAILGPRGLPALTFAVGAVGGAALMYVLMRGPGGEHSNAALHVRAEDGGAPIGAVFAPGPASDAEAASPSPSLTAAPELRADGGAERPGAGSTMSARDQYDASDAIDFDDANTAYQSGAYEKAIKALRDHARKYPRSLHADTRDRLLTLALIRAGHKVEARQRIEALRKASPTSPLLNEFDTALPPDKRP